MARAAKPSIAIAFIGSFAVYLLPIITPHVTVVWGVALWAEMTGAAAARPMAWLAADLGLALVVQMAAGGIIYWVARRPTMVRGLTLLATVPLFYFGLTVGTLIAIPTFFLIEGEKQGAHGDWAVACTVPNATLAASAGGPDAPLVHAREAWLIKRGPQPNARRLALLTAADCATRDLPITTFRTRIRQTVPGGGALWGVNHKGSAKWRLYVQLPGGRSIALTAPAKVKYWRPVLSRDAARIAWIERRRGPGRSETRWFLQVRLVGSAAVERRIEVRMDRPAALRLIAFDAEKWRFLARRNEREFVTIDATGGVTPVAEAPRPGIHPTQRYIRLDRGWVSWDVYRDKGRARVAWRLDGRTGLHEVPKGRGIRAVSVSADGRLIALSVGGNLRIGSVKDAVYVIRAADGKEVYRRFLTPYARSQPAFLGRDRLAFTAQDGDKPVVRVLKVPPPAAGH